MVKFDKDGVVDFYDPFGNKLELAKEIATPVDLDGKAVLNNYIEALGGIKKMIEVKTVKMVAGMNLMGQDFEMTIIKKAPNLYYQTMGNESMTIQEQVFDGTKAKMSGMGGSQIITEGEELDAIKKEVQVSNNQQNERESYGSKVHLGGYGQVGFSDGNSTNSRFNQVQ